MSHTNVNIERPVSIINDLVLENKILQLKVKFYQDMVLNYYSEIQNIPKAIKDHGYVDLKVGEELITLVEKKME